MSLDRSAAAIRAVNDFGLTHAEAADLFDVSQEWVSRELEKHFEDDEDGQEETCPVCGDTYDHKRESTAVSHNAVLRTDATQCRSDPDWAHTTTYYVHRDGTPPRDDPTQPAEIWTSPVTTSGAIGVGEPGIGKFDDGRRRMSDEVDE